MKQIEVIVTYMYNSDDATMQTMIVNSHCIAKDQYVAIIIIICTRTKPATLVFLVTHIIVVLKWGNKGGEEEGEVG